MRTRDEVLREFGSSQCILGDKCVHQHCRAEMAMVDRIRELESQLTLPPIREKFVRVSDELVAELKAAPSKPVTVAIVEDGNELHMTFTESQQAASEPVAWAADGRNVYGNFRRVFLADKQQVEKYASSGYKITPLYTHPSAAAVTVTEEMVNAAARRGRDYGFNAYCDNAQEYWAAMESVLTAALTRPTTPTPDKGANDA